MRAEKSGKNNRYKMIFLVSIMAGLIVTAGCSKTSEDKVKGSKTQSRMTQEDSEQWEKAQTTPYDRYPETVTYTLAQMSGANNSNMPQGATYEDNAYTRYLKEMLNIQNENTYMESEDRYNEFVNVLIKDRTLPDVMVISDKNTLDEMVENDLVEDLTDVYNCCTSDKIKEMYDSYGAELLDSVRYDGRLMAMPETVIDHGPCLLWLRKDWMEQLGLEEPESLEDAFNIIEEFQKNRMGAEDGENPIGLVCDTSLVGTTSSSYSVDPVFQEFGTNPQRWQRSEDGRIVYGSLTEETKDALQYLNKLYERGILDQNFALRASNNLRDLVVNGKCGAFFGLWWTPNNPLMEEHEKNPESDWEPYYFPADMKTASETYASFRDNKYVVVRKGYEHPEIVMKILSVLFDYTRYEADDAEEVNSYFALNVDPTARPLVINVDYNEATYKVTEDMQKVIAGKMREEELSAIEKSYYSACMNYLKGKNVTGEDWAAYKSRISAVGVLVEAHYQPPGKIYLETSDLEVPQMLQTLERDAFIQIIMGRQPLSYFDEFVQEWYAQGGTQLLQNIRDNCDE